MRKILIELIAAIFAPTMAMAVCSCGEDAPEATPTEEQAENNNRGTTEYQPAENETGETTGNQPGSSSVWYR